MKAIYRVHIQYGVNSVTNFLFRPQNVSIGFAQNMVSALRVYPNVFRE